MNIPRNGAAAALVAMASVALSAGVAPAKLTPNPYRTSVGTGSFTGDSVVGPSTCAMSKLVAKASGTGRGANVKVRGFEAACTGVITTARYEKAIPFRIRRGAVSGKISILITNSFGGECRYAGPVTGSIRKGAGTLKAAGTVTLRETVAAPCA